MSTVSTPDLTDNHPQARVIELQFISYGALKAFSGEAVTIKCHEDNSLVKACVAEPGLGRVIVVDGGGSLRGLCWVICWRKKRHTMSGLE